MNLDELLKTQGAWLRDGGEDSDVVVSSRIRLARNISGFQFVGMAKPSDLDRIVDVVFDAAKQVLPKESFSAYKFAANDPAPEWLAMLFERQLVSAEFLMAHSERGAVVDRREEYSAIVNEEDHLRVQSVACGFALDRLWAKVNELDDLFGTKLNYSYHERFGYLTTSPANVGTGMRASVMLHLPGLIETGELARAFRSLEKVNLDVRGVFGGRSRPLGQLFQVSNRVTLGVSEQDVVKLLNEVVPHVIEYERKARQTIVEKDREGLLDRCFRALGVLKTARVFSLVDAMEQLSSLRLGVHMKLFDELDEDRLNRVYQNIQPFHLKQYADGQGDPETDEAALRAQYLRKAFGAVS